MDDLDYSAARVARAMKQGRPQAQECLTRLGDLRPGYNLPGPLYRRSGGQFWMLLPSGEHTYIDDDGHGHGYSERPNPDELVVLVDIGNGWKKRYFWRELIGVFTGERRLRHV